MLPVSCGQGSSVQKLFPIRCEDCHKPIFQLMGTRTDIALALRGRTVTFFGSWREIRRLPLYLHENEVVNDIVACTYGQFKGRALIVVTDERILMLKDGWIRRNSQAVSYSTLKSVEIATHLFFCDVTFSNEGLEIKTTKIGRFSGKHMIGIVRGRIGARFSKWQREKVAVEGQDELLNLPRPASTPPAALETGSGPFQTVSTPPRTETANQAVTEPSLTSNPLVIEDIHFPTVDEVLSNSNLSTQTTTLTDDDVDAFISGDDEKDIFPDEMLAELAQAEDDSGSSDFMKHLHSLERMKQQGTLNEEEFQQAKRRLFEF